MVVEQGLEFDRRRDLYGFLWSFYKHLNVGSSHLWPSRYVCTRRVQFTFRNIQLQEVSFSNNDDFICGFIDRNKEYLLCNFSIFLFNDFTERLVGSLYKCGCLVKFSILILMMCKNSLLPVVKGMHSDAFRFHHRLQYVWSASATILQHLVKSFLDGSLYIGPFSKSDRNPLSGIQVSSPVTTWPAGGYRNVESAQEHEDWMELRTSGSEVLFLTASH